MSLIRKIINSTYPLRMKFSHLTGKGITIIENKNLTKAPISFYSLSATLNSGEIISFEKRTTLFSEDEYDKLLQDRQDELIKNLKHIFFCRCNKILSASNLRCYIIGLKRFRCHIHNVQSQYCITVVYHFFIEYINTFPITVCSRGLFIPCSW